jgi:uncharacterized protein (DUF2267 family)
MVNPPISRPTADRYSLYLEVCRIIEEVDKIIESSTETETVRALEAVKAMMRDLLKKI